MKLVQVGDKLINLDKVLYLDLETNQLHLQDEKVIDMSQHNIDSFVFDYNLLDTDEIRKAITSITRSVRLDPNLLSKDGLIETITIMVRMYHLTDDLKSLNEGRKLKELSISELVNTYLEIREKAEKIKEERGF